MPNSKPKEETIYCKGVKLDKEYGDIPRVTEALDEPIEITLINNRLILGGCIYGKNAKKSKQIECTAPSDGKIDDNNLLCPMRNKPV